MLNVFVGDIWLSIQGIEASDWQFSFTWKEIFNRKEILCATYAPLLMFENYLKFKIDYKIMINNSNNTELLNRC